MPTGAANEDERKALLPRRGALEEHGGVVAALGAVRFVRAGEGRVVDEGGRDVAKDVGGLLLQLVAEDQVGGGLQFGGYEDE